MVVQVVVHQVMVVQVVFQGDQVIHLQLLLLKVSQVELMAVVDQEIKEM